MSKLLKFSALAAVIAAPVAAETLPLGRAALPEEVAAWDIDIRPDGLGLPVGSGSVWDGEELYEAQCAYCHGTFGEAVGAWPVLAGGHGSLANEHPEKTIGSYWPYLSTVYDYIHRAMPYGNAQSLQPDEVYAITAYVLYLNDLVDDDFELSSVNFAQTRLPNEDGFYMDDRIATEWPTFTQAPCMTDCGPEATVAMRAAVLDVTPDDPISDARAAQFRSMNAGTGVLPVSAPAAPADTTPEPQVVLVVASGYSDDMIAAGERAFRQCAACHQVGDSARNGTGPMLNGVYGHPAAGRDGFRYSDVLRDAGADGMIWDNTTLDAFLENPRDYLPRNRMSFRGVGDADERQALIAYLSSFAE